jgi:hypothetical protein
MKIDGHMSLGALAEHMGSYATIDEAERMRTLLAGLPYADTKHVPNREWSRLLSEVAQRDPA